MVTSDTHTTEQQDTGRYEDCIVAFLDILGFKSTVLDSEDNADTLDNIIQSLKIVNAIPSDGKKVTGRSGATRTIQIRSRFFSDSLVFFLKKNPEDIAQLFFVIRYLQDQLWDKGICLRGSIVRGPMYWTESDDNVTVGQGLIDAHKSESTVAIYPRILVSDTLYEYIEQQQCPARPFGSNDGTPLVEFIRQDSDGVRFLDLLNPGITRPEGEQLDANMGGDRFTIWYNHGRQSLHSKILGFIDSIIRDNEASGDDRTKQKYAWLRTYRNSHDG